MNTIEKLLRMKYILPDEEIFEPAATAMRHITASKILSEIIVLSDDFPVLMNELLNEVRDELERLNVKWYREKINGHNTVLYKVLNKIDS